MTIRRNTTRAALAFGAAAAVACGTAAAAGAAPVPAPQAFGVLGDDVIPIPSGPCNGVIHVDRQTDTARPGNLRLIFTSHGSYGTPRCPVTMQISWINGIAPFQHSTTLPVTAGRAVTDLPAGPGVSLVSAGVHDPLSKPVSSYVWVAP